MTVTVDDLAKIPAFQTLSPPQLVQLASMLVRQSYMPGELIFLEGDESVGLWFVLRGRVKIIKQSLGG
ncbi:MAG: cyclic nucleotide-binding domain-containing protein, partial [Chloroflexi bacterium]